MNNKLIAIIIANISPWVLIALYLLIQYSLAARVIVGILSVIFLHVAIYKVAKEVLDHYRKYKQNDKN